MTLDCKDEDNKPTTMQKKVQIITNCSCSSCTETSRIKQDDYNTFLQSLADENLDKNVNLVDDTPDILLSPSINESQNNTKEIVKFLEEYQSGDDLNKSNSKTKVLLEKLNEIKFEKLKEPVEKEKEPEPIKHEQHLHRGPHHSLVLDAEVKEKLDVMSHQLVPAVAGQEISYHDNVLGDKDKKKDF